MQDPTQRDEVLARGVPRNLAMSIASAEEELAAAIMQSRPTFLEGLADRIGASANAAAVAASS